MPPHPTPALPDSGPDAMSDSQREAQPRAAAGASPHDLSWERDGPDWPLHRHSRFIEASGLMWHVQQLGPSAPSVLLLHGTGASTHSWRGVAPRLAERFRVISLDLPGHAFTRSVDGDGGASQPAVHSLPGMAQAVAALLRKMGESPALVVGHSAGAAIGLRMVLDGLIAPRAVVSFNGALLPLGGVSGQLFSPMAKLLAMNPLVPRVFAWRAQDRRVLERLIGSTGSRLDEAGLALYGRLIRSPAHAAGALAMMAHWDLRPLQHDLPRLALPLHLIVGEQDRTVPPTVAQRVKTLLPGAELVRLPGLGHLAHEEAPDQAVDGIVRAMA